MDEKTDEFLAAAMDALWSGDAARIDRFWAPSLTWYGMHRSGDQREYQGLAGLFEAMSAPPQVVETVGNEVLDVWPIGHGVIAARVSGRRRALATGEEIVSEFLFAVRVEDGRITRVIDLVDAPLADFWRRATAAGG